MNESIRGYLQPLEDQISRLRFELYDAKRERDELMAANVDLSQTVERLRQALLSYGVDPSTVEMKYE